MTFVFVKLTAPSGALVLFFLLTVTTPVNGNPDAKRLYDDLLSSYNRLIRPVSNNTNNVTVKLGLRLSQLIDLNLKDQILTTNVWVEHEWTDYKCTWDPEEYGGVEELYVPAEHIWVPDIVLYNNADGEYGISTMTKAILHYNGRVIWNPPAIFKSYCEIDVRYFPFDQQHCFMKLGSWSYDGFHVDLQHKHQQPGEQIVEIGIDLKEYYPSVEWDILTVPAQRNQKFYSCCSEPYLDIYFNLTLRRKTLFYTVNLIIPCVGISYLSVLVFYLPADSGEKVALCINVLLSQTMFFLLISEIIPSTSLAVPLLGKYLLFTMFLVGFNVLVTIIILNIHYRKPATHKMAPWVRILFIKTLPKILLMRVPYDEDILLIRRNRSVGNCNGIRYRNGANNGRLSVFSFTGIPPPPPPPGSKPKNGERDIMSFELVPEKSYPLEIERTIRYVRFIQDYIAMQDRINEEDADWGFVAMVLDRLFLWIFSIISLAGTIGIICEAPALYDDTQPIDIKVSLVAQEQLGLERDHDF